MRLYTFVNFYLSSIQQGIQTAHLVSNLFSKYHTSRGLPAYEVLYEWAKNHKTIIVLNGGTKENINNIFMNLWLYQDVNLPFDKFNEDEDSLGGITTCCGIVVPEEMYEAEQADKVYTEDYFYTNKETTIRYENDSPAWNIIDVIKSHHLAR